MYQYFFLEKADDLLLNYKYKEYLMKVTEAKTPHQTATKTQH
jgi:hypothetical protein